MIGQPMSVRIDKNTTIKLAPFTREDVGAFIKDGRMQYHSISRYLSIHHALTIEDEQEWYDKMRKDYSTSKTSSARTPARTPGTAGGEATKSALKWADENVTLL